MKIGKKTVKIFKIMNRSGYAALCADHLTEGTTRNQAYDRMVKAISRTTKKNAKKKTAPTTKKTVKKKK